MRNQKTPILAIYGKGKVGLAVWKLAESLDIHSQIFDDADASFDPSEFTFVLPSPGIPPRNRAFSGGNTISELDFAHRYLPKGFKIIAITGTDGKSTTAWIVFELLRKEFGESHVFLSGNFEIPISETVRMIRERGLKKGYLVVEVSSFMANGIGTHPYLLESLPPGFRTGPFFADYTIFTNFETDHLDWHGDMAAYFEAKMNLIHHTKSRVIAHDSLKRKGKFPDIARWYGSDPWLKDRTDGETLWISWRKKYRLSQTELKGTFNAMNLLAATCVTNELKICSKRTSTYLSDIRWLPHRLEFVAVKNGVTYVDDSKSTSAQSLKVALESYQGKKVILIAGGSDKGDDFDHLESLFWTTVRYLIAMGATRERFGKIAKSQKIEHFYADSMKEAVAKASQIANLWEVVLLSPGCASFWLFQNYLDRAHQFIDAVQSIPDSHVTTWTIPH